MKSRLKTSGVLRHLQAVDASWARNVYLFSHAIYTDNIGRIARTENSAKHFSVLLADEDENQEI